jgi:phenylacetate-CoA oxygenase PaaH subunit
MPISKIRQQGEASIAEALLPTEPELRSYEVFTRKARGLPHIHAGALHAPDMQSALQLAREHYGQDESCVHIWVVDRGDLGSTSDAPAPINKAVEHAYRYARDYQGVRSLWKQFRDEQALRDYEKDDLKESF